MQPGLINYVNSRLNKGDKTFLHTARCTWNIATMLTSQFLFSHFLYTRPIQLTNACSLSLLTESIVWNILMWGLLSRPTWSFLNTFLTIKWKCELASKLIHSQTTVIHLQSTPLDIKKNKASFCLFTSVHHG